MTNPEPGELTKQIVQGEPVQDVRELIAEAKPAKDTEDLLLSLETLQGLKGRWNKTGDLYQRYEELRDRATDALVDSPRYFIGIDGVKMVAVRQQAEPVEIDLDALAQEIDEATLAEIAPRKLDKELFKRAVAAGRIKPKTLVKVAVVKPSAAYVKFIRADDAAESD